MNQPEKITVTLSDGPIEVRKVSRREMTDQWHAILQRRIQRTDGIEEPSPRQKLIEQAEWERMNIATATRKSEQWVNQLSRDDQETILQALLSIHAEWMDKVRARERAVDGILNQQPNQKPNSNAN